MKFSILVLLACFQLRAATYFVTIAGLGGTHEYESQFQKWSSDLANELGQNGPDAHVISLTGAAATGQHIQQTFSGMTRSMTAEDAFAVFLIGHGTFDGTDYKFNVPGPDLSASELKRLMDGIPARRQLFVNMTSCSGASLAALARKDRIVITATKSGTEKNATVFARYWIDALRDLAADTDKNGVVSALEAFRYAQQKTAAYFDSEKLLATEHALLSDTGATHGVRDPKPETRQGLLASAFPLLRPPDSSPPVALNPAKQKLLSHKQDLEAKIDALKYQKPAMLDREYQAQLTALLLELARTQAEIEK